MTAFTLTNSAWTELGSGPATISLRTAGPALIAVSATEPAGDADAVFVGDVREFETGQKLWGKGVNGNVSIVYTPSSADGGGGGVGGSTKGTAFITNVATAVGLGTIPAGATVAYIQVESQSVRYRSDGTNPTAAIGTKLDPEDILIWDKSLTAIKFIEVAASPAAKLNVEFY